MWGRNALLAIGLLGQATAFASPVLLVCRDLGSASHQVIFDELTGALSLDGFEVKGASISSTLITWNGPGQHTWHIDRTDGSWNLSDNAYGVEQIEENGFCQATATKPKF
jgi:hypothetical protein